MIIDNAIRVVRLEALKHVHSEVNVVDGVADETGLRKIEGGCQGALNGIKSTFSSARIEIPEGQDVLATEEIDANIKIVPKGTAKVINLTFGLVKL